MRLQPKCRLAILALFIVPVVAELALAQEKPATAAKKPSDGWDDIDERLIFLMVRLANVEASLDAIDSAIRSQSGEANRAEQAGNRADRQAQPLKLAEFYAKTAGTFFYRPPGQDSAHYALAILQPAPVAAQPNAAPPKPPRIDEITRAYHDAKAPAEAAIANCLLDELQRRRQSLEDEQCRLWCEIVFRAVRDVSKKPLYRFEPYIASTGTINVQRAQAVRAAVLFLQSSLAVISQAERDQTAALGQMKQAISDAHERLEESWLRQTSLAAEARDVQKPLGRFAALAKRLDDVASNLADSYRAATDGDTTNEARRARYRALVQELSARYIQTVLAMDEMLALLAGDWQIKQDLNSPLSLPTSGEAAAVAAASPVQKPVPAVIGDKGWRVYKPDDLRTNFDLGARAEATAAGIEFTRGVLGQETAGATSREDFKFPIDVEFTVAAMQDGCFDIWPAVGEIKLEWGTHFNRETYVYVRDVRYMATHVPIVPGQENVVRMAIDRNGRLVVTINDREVLNRKLDVEILTEGKIHLGGGIGHVEYRQVRVRTSGAN